MEQLVILDWVFLLVLLVSLCLGLMSGLVQAVIALGSWFVSYAVAQWGAQDLSVMLPLKGYEPPIPFMLAFALLFIVSFMACALLSWLLQRVLQAVGLRPVDRLLGGVFGLARGFLILVVLVSVVHLTPVRSMQWWQQSKGQDTVLSAIAMFRPLLPDGFTRYLPVAGSRPAAAPAPAGRRAAGMSEGKAANIVVPESVRATGSAETQSDAAVVQPWDDLEAFIQMQQLQDDAMPDERPVESVPHPHGSADDVGRAASDE